jgi:hypothetical protein
LKESEKTNEHQKKFGKKKQCSPLFPQFPNLFWGLQVLFCNKSKSSFFFFSVTMTMGIISSAFLFSAFFAFTHPSSSPQAPEATLYVFFENLLVVVSKTSFLAHGGQAHPKVICYSFKSRGFFGGKNSNKASPLNILRFPSFVCTGQGTQSLGVWLV